MISDIGKVIQSEVAKCFGHYMQRSQSHNTSNDVNMVHKDPADTNPFDGHYAFSIVSSMQKNVWIIYSGASSHVCCDIDMMVSTYVFETPLSVGLPDGTTKKVFCGGAVRKNKDI